MFTPSKGKEKKVGKTVYSFRIKKNKKKKKLFLVFKMIPRTFLFTLTSYTWKWVRIILVFFSDAKKCYSM